MLIGGFLFATPVFAEDFDNSSTYSENEVAQVIPAPNLEDIEKTLYGASSPGAMIERLDRVEKTLIGTTRTGTILARLQADADRVRGGNTTDASILLRVNVVEWGLNQEIENALSLVERVAKLETRLLGNTSGYSLETRSKSLVDYVVEEADYTEVLIPKGTIIWVEFVDAISSKEAKEGDQARYKVAKDLWIDGYLVLPKGSLGSIQVDTVKAAKKFSRNGKMVVSFKGLETIDGRYIGAIQEETAIEATAEYAATLDKSAAEKIVTGRLGNVSNAFFSNQNASIKIGDQMYLETDGDYSVISIRLQ